MCVVQVYDILNSSECSRLIEQIDNKPSKDRNRFSTNKSVNDKFIDKELSDFILDKVRNHFRSAGIGRTILTAKYFPGELTGIHRDLQYDRGVTHTMIIYLNDNYQGGTTSFYDESYIEIHHVEPKKGKAIIFDFEQLHKGNLVEEGYKYWIGCQIRIEKPI